MAKKVRDIFSSEASRSYNTQLEGISGIYRFDVSGAGTWFAVVKNGNISISQQKKNGKTHLTTADCIITCDEEDFMRIAEGKQNLLTAAMQGLVTIQGDIQLAQRLYAVTRSRHPKTQTTKPNVTATKKKSEKSAMKGHRYA